MSTFRVYIEIGQEAIDKGGPLAHVPELPGCTARGATIDQAKDAIRRAVQDTIAFLRAQGENLSDDFELEFEMVTGYTLAPDYDPLTPQGLARIQRRLAASRQAVLAELGRVPPEAWDWKPGEKEWSLRTIVGHMSNAEMYLTDKLIEPERAPFERLAATRQVALERLQAISTDNLDRVTTFEGEDWTPAKVLRRMLEHEQEHLAQIRAIMAQYNSHRRDARNAQE